MVGAYRQQEINCLKGLYLLFIVLSIGCTSSKKVDDSLRLPATLNKGDIVVRQGNGYFSSFFRKLGSHEKKYSHIGLIDKVGDSLFVIHIEASELTGQGEVLRESITAFLKDIDAYAFYANMLSASQQQAVVSQATAYYKAKVAFDLEFDSANDDKLYCSELVAMSINKALDSTVIRPTLQYKEVLFYGLDDIYNASIFQKIE